MRNANIQPEPHPSPTMTGADALPETHPSPIALADLDMAETMTAANPQPEPRLSSKTPADRSAAGKRLRDRVPRDAHAGWRAHAGRADPWTISGYLGKGGQFDDAMGNFALAYADQAEKDHAALKAAVRAGIVEVQLEH